MTKLDPGRLSTLLREASDNPVPDGLAAIRHRAARRRRIERVGAVVTTAVVAAAVAVPLALLTGGSSPAARKSEAPTSRLRSTANPVLELIGLWRVKDAGEKPGTSVAFDAGTVSVYRRCGELDGGWIADLARQFSGSTSGGSSRCFHLHQFSVRWLVHARSFRIEGHNAELLGSSEHVLAELAPESSIPLRVRDRGGALDSTPPQVTPSDRRDLAPPAQLPAGVVPASPAAVMGRWRRLDAGDSREAHIAFGRWGWTGSDGCNGYGGKYFVGPNGDLQATQGPNTDVGCVGLSPVPTWVGQGRVGVEGHDLVFYSHTGRLLGKVAPDPKRGG